MGSAHTLSFLQFQKFLSKVEETFQCICCQELVFRPITTVCQHNVCKVRGAAAGRAGSCRGDGVTSHCPAPAATPWHGGFAASAPGAQAAQGLVVAVQVASRPLSRAPVTPLPCTSSSRASGVLQSKTGDLGRRCPPPCDRKP